MWDIYIGVDNFEANFETVGCYENFKISKLITYLNGFKCDYWDSSIQVFFPSVNMIGTSIYLYYCFKCALSGAIMLRPSGGWFRQVC